MESGILTKFNFGILHWQQVAGAKHLLARSRIRETAPEPEVVEMSIGRTNEAGAGDAAPTSILKVPGGHR